MKKIIILTFALFVFGYTNFASAVQEISDNEYIIGPGDVVAIKFWQKPEFNVEAKVSATGTIEIPLIGAIRVDGLTPTQLRDTIEGRISLLDVKITQVSVNIKEFGSKVVFITGGVVTPGKYYFEVIPNIWQIILEAGGPLATAQLDKVAVVHSSGESKGQIVYVNVAKSLESGDTSLFPKIYPGDTVHIATLNTEGQNAAANSPLQQRGVVYVWGAVVTPGVFNIQEDMDLMEAIVLAGGPAVGADISRVRLFFRERKQAEMAIIDMESYVNRSYPQPLMLHSGDAIYIPEKKSSLLALIGGALYSMFYVAAGYLISIV